MALSRIDRKQQSRMYDQFASDLFEGSLNLTVPWYLIASYAYYKENNPIFTDSYFDALGKMMLENWGSIEHIHKQFITKGDLEAGTFLGEYPSRIVHSLSEVRKENPNSRKKVLTEEKIHTIFLE